MKSKIDINSTVTLDEIKYSLQNNLSIKELVTFVLELGDKLSRESEYYEELSRRLHGK